MNSTVFVMLMVSASGNLTEAYKFNSLAECERVSSALKVNAVCIEKKPVDIQKEMSKMVSIMKAMQNELQK